MATVSKVTQTLFSNIKAELEFIDPTTAAIKNHLSVKTILMIKGSANFADYEAQKAAQHPISSKPPIGKRLDKIEQQLSEILNYVKDNRLL